MALRFLHGQQLYYLIVHIRIPSTHAKTLRMPPTIYILPNSTLIMF